LTPSFHVHDVEWTPERLKRFWAYIAGTPHADLAYFSSHSGDAIVAFAAKRIPLNKAARVLDYGCGPGYLLQRLTARGIKAEGLEFSRETLEKARTRCAASPNFGGLTYVEGLPSPVQSNSVDVVFLIEVIEHLLPGQVGATLDDIVRLLRPGGYLVLTTPHNEPIDRANTICPDCGCVFHPWQHVGSYTTVSMRALFQQHGLVEKECVATTLGGSKPGQLFRRVQGALSHLLTGRANDPARQPHLVCIAQKPGAR
jgi:2-polyprenyl-3-methyl-5-hydroxy-6-metoxy-1,4-benzoquinol methylase